MALLTPTGSAGLLLTSTATWAGPLREWLRKWSRQRWPATLALFCLALSCIAGSAGGADAPPGAAPDIERGVKAAFLYKFLGYVEYPPQEATGALVVGVMGADDIAAELLRVTAGRAVGGRGVMVRAVRDGEPLTGLHMLFIGSEVARPAPVLRAAQQSGVLSVTEVDNALQLGSVINFRLVDDRVRFEVSLPAAEKSNIRLSSRLLSVAYHVLKGGQ